MLTRPAKFRQIVTRPDPRVHPTRGQLWDIMWMFLWYLNFIAGFETGRCCQTHCNPISKLTGLSISHSNNEAKQI